MKLSALPTFVVVTLALCACHSASRADDAKPDEKDDGNDKAKLEVVTPHSAMIGGTSVSYSATAGYLYLKDFSEGKKDKPDDMDDSDKDDSDKGDAGTTKEEVKVKIDKGEDKDKGPKKKAKVFYIAYTRSGVDNLAERPVTFVFNGGPGSASIWLHMGGLGPRRAALSSDGEATPPPYKMVDNESSWLDDTDLVFIDPVSTGFSRTMNGEDPKQYHGLKQDIASVGEFIRLYLTKNGRWSSPKFIAGESYGTTRAAGLSDYLQSTYGIYVNGIVLISSVLNFQDLVFAPGNDVPYADFLPTFATVAWYHKKLSPDLEAKSVADVAQMARDFAGGPYKAALGKGDLLSDKERDDIAGQIAALTGLSKADALQQNLRISDSFFFPALLKDQNKILGRYDARFTGLSYHPGTDSTDWDPSDEAVNGPFTAVFHDYLHADLKFDTDIPYNTVSDKTNEEWDFGKAVDGYPNTAEPLRQAMTRNPYLKVWITCSYYDLATPYFNAESMVAHMGLDPSLRPNIRLTYYESGHMLYIHEASRHKFKSDFEAFLKDAIETKVIPTAAR